MEAGHLLKVSPARPNLLQRILFLVTLIFQIDFPIFMHRWMANRVASTRAQLLFYTHGLMTRACLSAPIAARHTHRKLHLEQHVLADIFLSLYPISYDRHLPDIESPSRVLYQLHASTVSTLHSRRQAKSANNIVISTVSSSKWLYLFRLSLITPYDMFQLPQ
jgi:hypothetical protein